MDALEERKTTQMGCGPGIPYRQFVGQGINIDEVEARQTIKTSYRPGSPCGQAVGHGVLIDKL